MRRGNLFCFRDDSLRWVWETQTKTLICNVKATRDAAAGLDAQVEGLAEQNLTLSALPEADLDRIVKCRIVYGERITGGGGRLSIHNPPS